MIMHRKKLLKILTIIVLYLLFMMWWRTDTNLTENGIIKVGERCNLLQLNSFIESGTKLYSKDWAYDCYRFEIKNGMTENLILYCKKNGYPKWEKGSISYGPVVKLNGGVLYSHTNITGSLVFVMGIEDEKFLYLIWFRH